MLSLTVIIFTLYISCVSLRGKQDMPVSGKELIRELKREGYMVKRISGSHCVLVRGAVTVVVPNHNDDLPKGTEMAIRKIAGVMK